MSRLAAQFRVMIGRLDRVLRRIIGAPDHEEYLEHMRRHHPRHAPLSRDDFHRDALARRYERPGSRCC